MNRATIIAGLCGGLIALLFLAPATGRALGELKEARAKRDAIAIRAAAPPRAAPPLTAPELRAPGGSEAIAARSMVARIRHMAADGGVLTEQAAPVAGGAGLVRLKLRLSGPERAVIAIIDRIEREPPLIRFAQWTATAMPDGGLRVEGEAVAAWR